MTEWLRKRSGWITLILLAAVYYPLFGKGVRGLIYYVQAGQCILSDQPLIACAPGYSYSPALAALVIPIGSAPAVLQELIWYVICVGSLVITVRLAEAMAGRLYPGAALGRNLIWLRAVTLGFCAKHILDAFNYEAYDAPALAMIMLGVWALTGGRTAKSGFWLGAATAVRATPLIFLPYLMVRRRYLAAAVFVVAFFAFAVLPDLVGALRGGHVEYLRDWALRVAGPALLPGHAEDLPFWNSWTGPYLDNQSLRGLVNRFAQGPVLGLSPTLILLAIDAAFALPPAALVLLSPRDNKRASIDGAVLLIATLALAPMTSRYHFAFVLPAVALISAAALNDARMRVPGSLVLAASFVLLTGTSNDLVGRRLTEFAYRYGFMVWGAAVLLVALAMMTWVFRPPSLAAERTRLPRPAWFASMQRCASTISSDLNAARLMSAALCLLGRDFVDDRIGAAEAFRRDRDAGIDRGVQEDLGDLLRRDAVVERAADMDFEFVPARQRGEHADIEHAAGLTRDPVAQPDIAPALRLGELDEVLGERVGLLLAGIDIGGAQHLAAHLRAAPRSFAD